MPLSKYPLSKSNKILDKIIEDCELAITIINETFHRGHRQLKKIKKVINKDNH